MKGCLKCGEDKPLEEFHRCKSKPDGHWVYCKECARGKARAWRAANVEKARASDRRRYQEQPERKANAIASSKAFRAANPEKARESSRQASKRWAERNRDTYLARKRLETSRRRVTCEGAEYAAIVINDPCAYCGGEGGTLDHITPVIEGGSNDWDNLTGACLSCNSSKNATPLLQFMAR